jgi:hypothetical protein
VSNGDAFGSAFLLDWMGSETTSEHAFLGSQFRLDPETLSPAKTTIWKQSGTLERFELC